MSGTKHGSGTCNMVAGFLALVAMLVGCDSSKSGGSGKVGGHAGSLASQTNAGGDLGTGGASASAGTTGLSLGGTTSGSTGLAGKTGSAAGGSSSASNTGQGGSAGTGGISSSGGSGTSTSASTTLDAATNPDMKTWNKTWKTISVARSGAAGFRPPRNTAASVTIKRGQDGLLVLSGKAFHVVSGDPTKCYINDGSACLEIQAFPETTLTPAEAAELDRQVAAMPPGECTPKPNWDPGFLTSFSIDDTSDVDYGTWLCLEDYGPGTHLAAARAIIAYIDSLIPAEADAGATTAAMADASVRDTR